MKREVLVICGENEADYYEQLFIKAYNTIVPNGYNSDSGGNNNKRYSLQSRNRQLDAKTNAFKKSQI